MDENLQQMLDSVPEDEPRSHLEPYRDVILRWRRQGRSYRRICKLLAKKCGVKVAYGPLYRFVQRRSRPRKIQPELQPELVNDGAAAVRPEDLPQGEVISYTKLSPEEATAQREFVRALRNKPVIVSTGDPPPLFVYDPSKPLTNRATKE